MAPELLVAESNDDLMNLDRCDMYAFGCVCYEVGAISSIWHDGDDRPDVRWDGPVRRLGRGPNQSGRAGEEAAKTADSADPGVGRCDVAFHPISVEPRRDETTDGSESMCVDLREDGV